MVVTAIMEQNEMIKLIGTEMIRLSVVKHKYHIKKCTVAT